MEADTSQQTKMAKNARNYHFLTSNEKKISGCLIQLAPSLSDLKVIWLVRLQNVETVVCPI